MKHGVIGAIALVSAIIVSFAQSAAAQCVQKPGNVWDCTPNGNIAIGAAFSASESGARRDVSLALVGDLLEEEAEDFGKGSGDRLPIELFATLLYGGKDYATENIPGFDSDTWGGIIGVAMRGDSYLAGLALDYSEESADYKDNAGSQDTNTLGVQAFGTFYPLGARSLYLSGAVRYAGSDFDTTRTFVTATSADPVNDPQVNQNLPTAAQGSTNGSTFSLLGGIGYDWLVQPHTIIGVSGWLSWADNSMDGYTETGSLKQGISGEVSGDLSFEDDNYSTFDGILTANVQHAIPIANGRIVPKLSMSYVHEFESDTRVINATVVDAVAFASGNDPSNSFIAYQTNDADPNYFLAGIGVTAELSGGTTIYASYAATLGHEWRNADLFTLGINQAF